MIDPNEGIAITLTAQEWNTTLGVLSDAPFRIVAPIINKMVAQTQAHAQIPKPAQAPQTVEG